MKPHGVPPQLTDAVEVREDGGRLGRRRMRIAVDPRVRRGGKTLAHATQLSRSRIPSITASGALLPIGAIERQWPRRTPLTVRRTSSLESL